jgi:hypothetical protein
LFVRGEGVGLSCRRALADFFLRAGILQSRFELISFRPNAKRLDALPKCGERDTLLAIIEGLCFL